MVTGFGVGEVRDGSAGAYRSANAFEPVVAVNTRGLSVTFDVASFEPGWVVWAVFVRAGLIAGHGNGSRLSVNGMVRGGKRRYLRGTGVPFVHD